MTQETAIKNNMHTEQGNFCQQQTLHEHQQQMLLQQQYELEQHKQLQLEHQGKIQQKSIVANGLVYCSLEFVLMI